MYLFWLGLFYCNRPSKILHYKSSRQLYFIMKRNWKTHFITAEHYIVSFKKLKTKSDKRQTAKRKLTTVNNYSVHLSITEININCFVWRVSRKLSFVTRKILSNYRSVSGSGHKA